jgi:hypothetical protein
VAVCFQDSQKNLSQGLLLWWISVWGEACILLKLLDLLLLVFLFLVVLGFEFRASYLLCRCSTT